MNWNMISALAELIGSATVVVSLVFLAMEVRHGNALERAEAYRAINLKASSMFTEWAKDDSFLHAARAGILGGGARLADLTPDEQTRIILHFAGAIRILETIHRQVEAGVLDHEAYRIMGGLMFRTPMFADVWARLKGAYADDFARAVEERFDVHGHFPPGSPPQPARTDASQGA